MEVDTLRLREDLLSGLRHIGTSSRSMSMSTAYDRQLVTQYMGTTGKLQETESFLSSRLCTVVDSDDGGGTATSICASL